MTDNKNEAGSPADRRAEFEALLDERIKLALDSHQIDTSNIQPIIEDQRKQFEASLQEHLKATRTHDLTGSAEETYKGEKFSLAKVALGLASGDMAKHAPMEHKMSSELQDAHRERLAQGTVPDSAGGFLVPTQVFEDQIIPLLRPQVIALALGVQQLPVTGAGMIELPREVTGPVVDNVAENQANADSDMEFGSMRMEPRTAQSFIKASRRFLSLGVGADSFIRARMAEELALQWNRWILKGSGQNGDPIGVYNTPGVGVEDFNATVAGGVVTPDFYRALLAMEDQLADANALRNGGTIGWACANRFVSACRQIASSNNSAGTDNLEMSRSVVGSGQLDSIIGYNFERTTQLAQGSATEAILGDWSRVVLATWNNLSIEASSTSEDAMKKRQVHMVAYIDADVAVTQPSSFVVTSNLNTSSL